MLLFKPKKNFFPARTEDIGLSNAIPIAEVIFHLSTPFEFHFHDYSLFLYMTADYTLVRHRFGMSGPRK